MTIAPPIVWPATQSAGQRTVMQIDAAYLATLNQTAGFSLDFRALRRQLEQATRLARMIYYADLNDGEDNRRPLIDWLDYNGYTFSLRTIRSERDAPIGSHVAIAVDAVSQIARYDHLVLLAGSRTLLSVVQAVRGSGPQVTIIGTLRQGPAEIDDGLRRAADHVVEIFDLRATLALPPKLAPSNRVDGSGPRST
jgi:uncharacterized LabA/DUF88 family protein